MIFFTPEKSEWRLFTRNGFLISLPCCAGIGRGFTDPALASRTKRLIGEELQQHDYSIALVETNRRWQHTGTYIHHKSERIFKPMLR